MIGIEHDQGRVRRCQLAANLIQNRRLNRRAFDKLDPLVHGVGLYGGAIVGSDLDIHPDDAPLAHGLEERGVEDQGAAMGDTGLDQHVGLDRIDDFLQPDHVIGQLDDRATHPAETVYVFRIPGRTDPGTGGGGEAFRGRQAVPNLSVAVADDHFAGAFVDGCDHVMILHEVRWRTPWRSYRTS